MIAECDTNGSGIIERQDVGGHDLLSLLIKSNIAADIPESMRMSDSEIISRERFFFFFSCPSTRTRGNNIRTRGTHIFACRA